MLKNFFKIFFLLFLITLLACEKKDDKTSESAEFSQIVFPTHAKAEYVMACMTSNQSTPEYLHKCSCSIDYIESQIPYDKYITAETLMSMRQIEGEKSLLALANGIEIDNIPGIVFKKKRSLNFSKVLRNTLVISNSLKVKSSTVPIHDDSQ